MFCMKVIKQLNNERLGVLALGYDNLIRMKPVQSFLYPVKTRAEHLTC